MLEKKQCMKGGTNTRMCQENSFLARGKRLKFWEVDRFFKCPVVGMCLRLSEQKQILKKAGLSVKKKTPFEIHETLVASSDSQNQLSKRVDNLLNRKFGKETNFLLGLDHEKFMAHCKAAFKCKDCIDALWAAAVRPGLSMECKKEIFGEIHMIMHWSGEQSMKLKRELVIKQKQVDDMLQGIKEATRARRSLQKENGIMRRTQSDFNVRMDALLREKTELEKKFAGLGGRSPDTEVSTKIMNLQEKLDVFGANSKKSQCRIFSLNKKNMQLSLELEQQRKLTIHFRKNTQKKVEEIFTMQRCDASCPSFDLCKKRILIIGGIERMESLYRKLIETRGGIFEYHDGCMKKGVKGLEYRFRRADVVLCPVSCNSHAACSIVKNLAKKYNKTVHLLANFSLNAVSQVIWSAENNRYIVN